MEFDSFDGADDSVYNGNDFLDIFKIVALQDAFFFGIGRPDLYLLDVMYGDLLIIRTIFQIPRQIENFTEWPMKSVFSSCFVHHAIPSFQGSLTAAMNRRVFMS